MEQHPNWVRGNNLLKLINSPNDLYRLWTKFGQYRFDSPEYTKTPWWQV